jgi:hypothetical protein
MDLRGYAAVFCDSKHFKSYGHRFLFVRPFYHAGQNHAEIAQLSCPREISCRA